MFTSQNKSENQNHVVPTNLGIIPIDLTPKQGWMQLVKPPVAKKILKLKEKNILVFSN